MQHADVCIIGAGPAGSAAALYCRQAGLSTIIIGGKNIGRSEQNRQTTPSESLHPGVVSILANLNATHCIEQAETGRYRGVNTNGHYQPLGEDERGSWQGYHVNRTLFDHALIQTATEHGAILIENEEVLSIVSDPQRVSGIITDRGREVSCSFLIDASGYKAVAGRELEFREEFHSRPLLAWTGLTDSIPAGTDLLSTEETLFIPDLAGWTWLAPQPDGRCTWTRLTVKGSEKEIGPPNLLKSYPLASPVRRVNRRWRVFRPVCKEGLILCGDAAAILDPAAGQGILNALLSAVMAGKTIKRCLENRDFEALYLAQYDDWLMNTYLDKVNRLKELYTKLGIAVF